MKKVAAFVTAFIIFIIVVISFHFCLNGDLNVDSKRFGVWNNPYKDLSYQAVASNIGDNTMMVFGSSEFAHSKKSNYHPAKFFKEKNINLMVIGCAYNQSLSHAITLGAVENKLVKRKAVILLSPTWFYKTGVKKDNYSLRFSESDYMALMENTDISNETKQYIANRSESLLTNNKAMLNRVKRCDNIYVENTGNVFEKLLYNFRKAYVNDKDFITVKTAMKSTRARLGKRKVQSLVLKPDNIEWAVLKTDAIKEEVANRSNPYWMSDRVYNRKIIRRLGISKNSHVNDSFNLSPEYNDLKCFLDICKETNVEPMIIIQPVNGYWYDYTGLTSDKRKVLEENVYRVAQEYNTRVVDFSNEEYSKYFFEDAVHPSGEGWLKINEKIYEFYNEA